MTDKVILVTAPDDILIDGLRILLVDLDPEQTQLVSTALTQLETIPTIITYLWKTGDTVDWLLDKKHKSKLIIFNANSENDVIIGYMTAQPNSHYFGILKSLSIVNNSAIYNVDQISNILEKTIEQNDKQLR
jgi:hypothetical protein